LAENKTRIELALLARLNGGIFPTAEISAALIGLAIIEAARILATRPDPPKESE
jgi:hypothetical protein